MPGERVIAAVGSLDQAVQAIVLVAFLKATRILSNAQISRSIIGIRNQPHPRRLSSVRALEVAPLHFDQAPILVIVELVLGRGRDTVVARFSDLFELTRLVVDERCARSLGFNGGGDSLVDECVWSPKLHLPEAALFK